MSNNNDHVYIFDTTLRDGEQSPGASMNLQEKLRIAEMLEALGVDIIEAGFPIASNGDFEAVTEIAKLIKKPVICGLSRAGSKDIHRAAEALQHAERKRIHTFISTSPLHMKFKLQMSPEDVHQAVIDSVKRAREWTDDVEWSGEDGSRTEPEFLYRCIESAIDAAGPAPPIPWTQPSKPLKESTVALLTTAGISMTGDTPFDMDGERARPNWGDPSWRRIDATATAEDVLALNPDGVFLSNGPGDPAATGAYAVPMIKAILEKDLPVFGICLGHQMLALALGAKTIKMNHGHHGANHPVKDHTTGKVEITSMNHGFTVDAQTLPKGVEETHVSLFDGSNCGIHLVGRPVFSVQYHPEASPGPQDSYYLFERFADAMDARAKTPA